MSSRAALVLIVLALVVGLQAGAYLARVHDPAEREREAAVPTVAPPALRLRCENGPVPRAWTRVDAEARYHSASQYLRVAEEAGLWNSTGRRAALMAIGQLLEVALCWPGEKKP